MSVVKEFREFVMRGNVVDLAVGVVVGAAFGKIVDTVVKGLITPLIGLVGVPDFSGYNTKIRGNTFLVGDILNSVISFLIIAAVVFFLVIKPINAMNARRKVEPTVEETTKECPQCLSKIPKAARRCAFCTSPL